MDTLNYTPSPGERDDPPPAQVQVGGGDVSGQCKAKDLTVMKDNERKEMKEVTE